MDNLHKNKRELAILIDPDKTNELELERLFAVNGVEHVDKFLVGSSLLSADFDHYIQIVKQQTQKPVVIFPGNAFQVSANADAFMLLNLVSGRNPDFLIGHHVMAAPKLKQLKIPVISTGYLLFGCGKNTSVQYMSNSMPIPVDKIDIAVATALAAEMIGMSQLYLEAGSGANFPIPEPIIRNISENVSIPIIVGGGIRKVEQAFAAWNAGANMVVVGNAVEQNPKFINELVTARATLR